MFTEHGLIHTWPVVKSVEGAFAHQFGQVVVACKVLREQNKVVPGAGKGAGPVRMVVADIYFTAENGLDPEILGCQVKGKGCEKVAVIGHGRGIHPVFLGFGAEVFKANGSVKQTIFRMAVQMDKIRHGNPAGAVRHRKAGLEVRTFEAKGKPRGRHSSGSIPESAVMHKWTWARAGN